MKTRHAFMCLLALLAAPALDAQAAPEEEVQEVQDAPAAPGASGALPDVDSVASDWKVRFPDAASRRDFRRLREYRAEKQNALNHEQSKLDALQATRKQVEAERQTWTLWASQLNGILSDARDSTIIIPYSYPDAFDTFVSVVTPGTAKVSELRSAQERLKKQDSRAEQTLAEIDSVARKLTAAIQTLNHDIRSAESTIDNALAPEYQSQKFRTLVSAFFALLIGIMIVSFFGTIYKKAGDSVGTLLLSDGGLQFVTIFVLIIAIILFGILNILEGRELAAILSGIAGYILGRGAQVKSQGGAGDAVQPQPAPAAPANDTPPPSSVRVPSIFLPPPPPPRGEAPPVPQTPPVETPEESPQPTAAG